MPEGINSAFGVIDKYLDLKDQMENGESEDEFMSADQQPPVFSSSCSPALPTQQSPMLAAKHNDYIQPHTVPQKQAVNSQQSAVNFLDINDFFLEELTPQTIPVSIQPSPVPSPAPNADSPASTTYVTVSEAAGSGGTMIHVHDQQLMEGEDSVDLYDLDKPSSFYEDHMPDVKPKLEPFMEWVTETRLSEMGYEDVCQAPVYAPGAPLKETESLLAQEESFKNYTDAIEVLRADIMDDCRHLGISSDPRDWKAADTQRWVRYILHKHQIVDDCSSALNMEGRSLCQHNEEFFTLVSPNAGPALHQQLNLWKTLADHGPVVNRAQQQHSTSHSITARPASQFIHSDPTAIMAADSTSSGYQVPPSISPASSTDSSSSTFTSSSGADNYFTFNWDQDTTDDETTMAMADRQSSRVPPSSSPSPRQSRPNKQIRLWEFLRELLNDSDVSMKWLDRSSGIFKIEDSNRVAKLWGERKKRPAMNYDKLSRSVRQYYKKGIIKKTAQSRRLVYQFSDRYL